MSRSRGTRAARLFVELGVVFSGVLIALTAETWWSGQGERERVRGYLGAVQADMATAQVQLDSAISRADRNLQGMRGFLERVRSGTDLSELAPGFAGVSLFIPTGTLDALLTTGDINLLTDQELRTRIVEEYALLTYRHRRLEAISNHHLNNIRESGRIREVLRHAGGGPQAGPVTIEAVRGSPQLIASFENYCFLVRNQISELTQMHQSVARLLEAIVQSQQVGV